MLEVKGVLRALNAREQQYSVEFAEKVINEIQMELFCEDDDVDKAVEIFQHVGETGHTDAGWIYVAQVDANYPIGKHGTFVDGR